MPEGKLVKEIPLFTAVGVWVGHFQVFDLLAKELNVRVHTDLQKVHENFIWSKVQCRCKRAPLSRLTTGHMGEKTQGSLTAAWGLREEGAGFEGL